MRLMKTKKKFRIRVMFRNTLLAILAAIVIWLVFSNLMTIYEQKKYSALGQLVEVDDKNMHVYTKGNGESTIVLLSGLGTAAPVLDFEPLINEMAKNNKVVVVEPFGYGWSDITDKDRTVENIVQEIRLALQKAKIEGPYILMPHSLSGIYSMYYANKYPEEVEAIIGIDPTLPKALDYFNESVPTTPEYMRFLALTGIVRLASYIIPNDFLPIAEEGTYSDKNLKMTKHLSAWNLSNKNIVAETNEIKHNVDKTMDMSFPSAMPVLIFAKENKKVTEDGKSNTTFYQTQLKNGSSNKLVTLEGHHYLHWTRSKEISEQVNNFISEIAAD